MLLNKQQHYKLPERAQHLLGHVLSCRLFALLSAQHPLGSHTSGETAPAYAFTE